MRHDAKLAMLARLARWQETAEYERARAALGVLWRYEAACRRAGRPVSVGLDQGERSHATGKEGVWLEDDVALIADVERLLGALTTFQRTVVVLVGIRRQGESAVARDLHCSREKVKQTYWRAVDALYWLLVGAKYLRPLVGGSDGEDQAEEAGAESSVAEVAAGGAGARGERAGARGV